MGSIYLAGFIVACVASFTATPFSMWLARRWNVLDQPSERKVHKHPIPRWGGAGIYLGILIALIGLYVGFPHFRMLLDYRHSLYEQGRLLGIISLDKQLAGILVGFTFVLVLGMLDDKRGVPAIPKLLTQIIASLVVINYGVQISGLRLPLLNSYVQFPILFSQVITVFWIIGFMNALNLADGLDGLAAGLAAIASATFLAVAIIQGNTETAFVSKQLKLAGVLSAVLCGSCLGFLPYNFAPAKVFMGDGGALGIGFLLGAITVIGTLKTTAVLSIMIPVIVVALPVIDVSLAIVRRFQRKARITEPDKEHLHHRLLNLGWTAREVVLLVYVLTLILSVSAIFLAIVKES
jgi:UDP-GlcNAc:undecaprenyl-phosphate/decaprenyl-phosphate GlcNAc-1-phosphate transferase